MQPNLDSDNKGRRDDAGKPEFHLIPSDAVRELGRVFSFGAEKYEPYNWERGMAWSRCYNSLLRHLYAYWDGERNDAETGLHHMAHCAWNALALLVYSLRGIGVDDRKSRQDHRSAGALSTTQKLERLRTVTSAEEIGQQNVEASQSGLSLEEAMPMLSAQTDEAWDGLLSRETPPIRPCEGMYFRIDRGGPIWRVKKILVEHTAEPRNQLFEAECTSHPELPDQMMRAKAILEAVAAHKARFAE